MEHKDYSERGFWSRTLKRVFGVETDTPCQTLSNWAAISFGAVIGALLSYIVYLTAIIPVAKSVADIGAFQTIYRSLSAIGFLSAISVIFLGLPILLATGDLVNKVRRVNDESLDPEKCSNSGRSLCKPYIDSKAYEEQSGEAVERDFKAEFSSLRDKSEAVKSISVAVSLLGCLPLLIGVILVLFGVDVVKFDGTRVFGSANFSLSMGMFVAFMAAVAWFSNQLSGVLKKKII